MHDPSFLLYRVPIVKLEIWHDEPGGKDAFSVCGWPRRGIKRLRYLLRHSRHLSLRWWPYMSVKRWIVDRCDGCGHRFLWRQGRFSYISTDKVWHEACMSLRSVRSQLNDITDYVRGTADSNARWRVEYRLEGLDEKEKADV